MEAIANSHPADKIECFAVDGWDGSESQASIFVNNSGWAYPMLMRGGQNGVLSDYSCGIDYVIVIGGDGNVKWRGSPVAAGFAEAVAAAVAELETSDAPDALMTRHKLLPGYPNPFNPMTSIPFELADNGGGVNVKLEILDVRGRIVRTLVDGVRSGGTTHIATWDGTDHSGRKLPSGTYMSRLKVDGLKPQARMLTLVK